MIDDPADVDSKIYACKVIQRAGLPKEEDDCINEEIKC